MKNKCLWISFLCLIGILTIVVLISTFNRKQIEFKTERDVLAEKIILTYIKEKQLNIRVGSAQYTQLIKGILLGEHLELINIPSKYVKTQDEKNMILDYAAKYMGLLNQNNQDEPEILEVCPTQ